MKHRSWPSLGSRTIKKSNFHVQYSVQWHLSILLVLGKLLNLDSLSFKESPGGASRVGDQQLHLHPQYEVQHANREGDSLGPQRTPTGDRTTTRGIFNHDRRHETRDSV